MNDLALFAALDRPLAGRKVVPAFDPAMGLFVLRGEQGKRVTNLPELTDLWYENPVKAKEVTLAGGGIWSSFCDSVRDDLDDYWASFEPGDAHYHPRS